MKRRDFLRTATFATAALQLRAQAPAVAKLTVSEGAPAIAVPEDFIGLSYESAQLANPQFFAAANTQLIALFRELSPAGVLRIGGGTSEFTTYSGADPSGPPPFEVFGPDTSHTDKQEPPPAHWPFGICAHSSKPPTGPASTASTSGRERRKTPHGKQSPSPISSARACSRCRSATSRTAFATVIAPPPTAPQTSSPNGTTSTTPLSPRSMTRI